LTPAIDACSGARFTNRQGSAIYINVIMLTGEFDNTPTFVKLTHWPIIKFLKMAKEVDVYIKPR
jgi:hypothetical protein